MYVFQERLPESLIISEFYKLRRTAIKDIAAYLGFLTGFIGSAPFAWGRLAQELDAGSFARGLWYFFGIVTAAGIFAGIAGLGLGIAGGTVWELIHRHRRRDRAEEPATATPVRRPSVEAPVAAADQVEPPRLQLVSSAGSRGSSGAGGPAAGQVPDRIAPARRPGMVHRMKPFPTGWPGLRDLVLAVTLLGTIGLIVELLLLEHTESWQQLIPLVVLGAGVIATATVRLRPRPSSVTAFRIVMGVFFASGLLGLYFHYAGNVEFALEKTPELSGFALVWEALRGATPTLAPGALAQLGLLGLVYAYRHPSAPNQPEAS